MITFLTKKTTKKIGDITLQISHVYPDAGGPHELGNNVACPCNPRYEGSKDTKVIVVHQTYNHLRLVPKST